MLSDCFPSKFGHFRASQLVVVSALLKRMTKQKSRHTTDFMTMTPTTFQIKIFRGTVLFRGSIKTAVTYCFYQAGPLKGCLEDSIAQEKHYGITLQRLKRLQVVAELNAYLKEAPHQVHPQS